MLSPAWRPDVQSVILADSCGLGCHRIRALLHRVLQGDERRLAIRPALRASLELPRFHLALGAHRTDPQNLLGPSRSQGRGLGHEVEAAALSDPDAQPPAGPGQPVTGGMAYWAVQLEAFPDGFAGPVTYGVVPPAAIDITAMVGGGDGPAALVSGQCYKAVALTTGFKQGSVTFAMP